MSKGAFIPNKRTLYVVKFPDGATYAAGQQGDIPGGIIAYLDREMAQQVADAIDGDVEARSLLMAIESCRKNRCVLWVRYADGGTGYVAETIPEIPDREHLIRVEGEERKRLIEVGQQQMGGHR